MRSEEMREQERCLADLQALRNLLVNGTTAPAPTMAFSPTTTPGRMIAPPPIHTLSSIVIGGASSRFARRSW